MNEYLDLGLITSFVPAASSFAGDIDFLFDLFCDLGLKVDVINSTLNGALDLVS